VVLSFCIAALSLSGASSVGMELAAQQ